MASTTNKISFASIGDSIVDVYPQENQAFLGGTAFNVSLHAQKAGVKTSLISTVGTDSWGKKFHSVLKKHHVNTAHLATLKGKTSHINITIDRLHRPIFSQWHLGVLKSLHLTQKHKIFLKTQSLARCVAFKPLLNLFSSFCQLNLPHTFKVADFSGDSIYSPSINIIPRYSPGLNLIVKNLKFSDKKSITFLKTLAQTQNKIVLILLGKQGSLVFTKDKKHFQPALKTKAKDTTGAGDAYLTHFLIHYLKTKNIAVAMLKATQAAAKTITQLGATS